MLVNRRFCFSTGLHKNSLVGVSGEVFRRRSFDALKSAGKDCPLGAAFYWRAVLPDPAPPNLRAPRRNLPVVCPDFGIEQFLTPSFLVPVPYFCVIHVPLCASVFRSTSSLVCVLVHLPFCILSPGLLMPSPCRALVLLR